MGQNKYRLKKYFENHILGWILRAAESKNHHVVFLFSRYQCLLEFQSLPSNEVKLLTYIVFFFFVSFTGISFTF